ncbi:hypothetical protein GVAV_000594 [Gurleya vavrai]
MEIEPTAKYAFDFTKIWFSHSVFVVQKDNLLSIIKYPNIIQKTIKICKNIEIVKITNKVQLLYKKENLLCLEEIDFVVPQILNKNFRHKNDHIFYKDDKIFCLEGEYNIIIDENKLKAFKYYLNGDKYIIEEYDLFFYRKGLRFDRFFFEKHELKYDCEFVIESNGKDFFICLYDIVTINLRCKRKIINDKNFVINKTNILNIKNDGLIEVYDLHLNLVLKSFSKLYFYSLYDGFVLCNDLNEELIDDYYEIDINNIKNDAKKSDQSSSKNKKTQNYTFIKEKNVKNFEIDFKELMLDKKYHFAIFNNKFQFFELKNNNFELKDQVNDTKNNFNILDYEFISIRKIHNIKFVDFYKNIILFYSNNSIILKYNNILLNKKIENLCVIDVNAKELKYSILKNNKVCKISVIEMLYCIFGINKETELEIDYIDEFAIENFVYKLLLSKHFSEAKNLLGKITKNAENIICKNYRKGDESIRNFYDENFSHILNNIKNAENMYIIYNCKTVDIKKFVIICTEQFKNNLIVDVYNFYKRNNLNSKMDDLISNLWEVGNLQCIKMLKIMDFSKYKFICDYLND